MCKPQRRKRKRKRNGATAVEFAFTLPIVLLIFFGFIEASRANMIRNSAKNAAYRGARRAVIPGGTSDEAIQAALNALSATGVSIANVDVSPVTITDETQQITVNVSVPFNENSWIIPNYFTNTTLSQSCTLTREASHSGF